jgi:hypothetical protein
MGRLSLAPLGQLQREPFNDIAALDVHRNHWGRGTPCCVAAPDVLGCVGLGLRQPQQGEGVLDLHDEIRKLLSQRARNEPILWIMAFAIALFWLVTASQHMWGS